MLTFSPAAEKQYALFLGDEQEGQHKGKPTLFVVGHTPFHLIAQQCAPMIRQIYFGAGGSFTYDKDSVRNAYHQFPKCLITVEAPVVDFALLAFLPRLEWMLPLSTPNTAPAHAAWSAARLRVRQTLLHRIQLKVENAQTVIVVPAHLATFADHADYADDKLIEV